MHSPGGLRCPDCASNRESPLYRIAAGHAFLAGMGGFLAAAVMGALLAALSRMGVLLLLAGFVGGGIFGELYLRMVGRKRGRVVEVMGIGVAATGLLLGGLCYFVAAQGVPVLAALLARPLYLIALGCFLFSAMGRLRL